jgi:hypothetical protein
MTAKVGYKNRIRNGGHQCVKQRFVVFHVRGT